MNCWSRLQCGLHHRVTHNPAGCFLKASKEESLTTRQTLQSYITEPQRDVSSRFIWLLLGKAIGTTDADWRRLQLIDCVVHCSFCPNFRFFRVKSIGPGILLVTGSGLRGVLCSKLVQLDWRETYITKMGWGGWVFSLACSLKVNLWPPGKQTSGSHKNKD